MAVTPTVYKFETSVKNSVEMYHYQLQELENFDLA